MPVRKGEEQEGVQQCGCGLSQLPSYSAWSYVQSCPKVAPFNVVSNFSGKWEEIHEELCVSNVVQRDSVLLATRLHPALTDVATSNELQVKFVVYHETILKLSL